MVAVVAVLLVTAGADGPKAEPKVVDLADLREAVAAAARRGANVARVGEALAALEKRFPNGVPVEGVPPPELAALEDAVAAAAAKGENVDGIRTHLKAVGAAFKPGGVPDLGFARVRAAYYEAFYTGDTAAMAKVEADNFMVFHDRAGDMQPGKAWREEIGNLAAAKQWAPRRLAAGADEEIRTAGPTAVVAGVGRLAGAGPDGARSFSEVWVKADGRWRLQTLHYDFRPAPAQPKK
jgi:ketosteroid isomerase-like protein